MVAIDVPELGAGEFVLRLNALRNTAAYSAYLAESNALESVLVELEDEVRALISDGTVRRVSPRNGSQLIADVFAATSVEIVIVNAAMFTTPDWELIDRRRSSLAHHGVLVVVTTRASFNRLMQCAPNFASWLGGEVFAYPTGDTGGAADSERRLDALRAWGGMSDEDIVKAARAGTLPRDPEYAEWLVLIGHGELLESGSS